MKFRLTWTEQHSAYNIEAESAEEAKEIVSKKRAQFGYPFTLDRIGDIEVKETAARVARRWQNKEENMSVAELVASMDDTDSLLIAACDAAENNDLRLAIINLYQAVSAIADAINVLCAQVPGYTDARII